MIRKRLSVCCHALALAGVLCATSASAAHGTASPLRVLFLGDNAAHRPADLETSTLHEETTKTRDAGERQLEADREEQEHDAQLREASDGIGLSDEPECMWADDHSREKEPDYRGDPEALGECYDRNRHGDQDDEIAENR